MKLQDKKILRQVKNSVPDIFVDFNQLNKDEQENYLKVAYRYFQIIKNHTYSRYLLIGGSPFNTPIKQHYLDLMAYERALEEMRTYLRCGTLIDKYPIYE